MLTSSLPGGPADKGGTNYEILWGLHGMMDVVQGRAGSIRIEPPGVDGAEFYLLRQGAKEHWQTKRQIIDQKTWSLQKLATEGVLEFFKSCAAAGEKAVFASISDAPELRILGDHARAAADFDEFNGKFLTGPRLKEFAQLRQLLGDAAEEETFSFLKKVIVESASENTLEERFLHPLLAALFTAPSISTQANLSTLYLNSVHQTLDRDQILFYLQKAGIPLREVMVTTDVRARLEAVTHTYLAGQRVKLISGVLVPRQAALDTVERLRGTSSQDILIAGSAGSGKSACFYQVITELVDVGIPVLAFRLDRLAPTVTTRTLGEQLGLAESPALVLARAHLNQPVVLAVDQLDFVSSTSGRHPDFFDTLAALIDEVRGLRSTQTIHLVLACRQFDFENDHRFRQLLPPDGKPLKLPPLTADEVKQVIVAAGGKPERLKRRQVELLGLPQNLALFIDSKTVLEDQPAFLSQKDLFDAYWKMKKKEAEVSHPSHATNWFLLLNNLTAEMSRRQELSVPKTFLDSYPQVFVDFLVSSGVLTFNERVYGFGHESFFDYCFARNTVSSAQEFSEFLEADDQLLFRRAQLRQVLVYLRDDNPLRYLINLDRVLNSTKIRPHLKLLALELVAAVPDPSVGEFDCLRPFLDTELPHRLAGTTNADKIATRTWGLFFASRTLFPAADRAGIITEWLASADIRLNDLAIAYLRWQLYMHSERIAELVEPFEQRADWYARLKLLVEGGDLEKSRRYFELALRLLERGVLDDARAPFHANGGFWTTVHGLAEAQPAWAAELAARWLDRQVVRAQSRPSGTGINLNDDSGVDDLDLAAKNAPAVVIAQVMPAVLRAVVALSDNVTTDGLPWDLAWSGHYHSEDLDLPEAYLQACKTAFAAISATNPEALRPSIQDLVTCEFDTANGLLIAAYESNAKHFADEALALMIADPRRLYSAAIGDSFWRARGLILACSPHCTEPCFRQIEELVLAFAPPSEKTADGYKFRGQAAYTLASGLDPTRTLPATQTQLLAWRDKFGEPTGPHRLRAYSVISPIAEDGAMHMSDDQWLRAMEKYHVGRPRNSSDYSKGGASELAGLLGTFVAKDPKRFAALAHRFLPEPEPNYLAAVLRNLKSAAIPGADKLAVARLAFAWPPENAAYAILELLGSIDDMLLPNEATDFIRTMAFDGPGPTGKKRIVATAREQEKEMDIRIDGLNTVRGRAIEAMANLIFNDRRYLERFSLDIERLARDASPAIRGCAAFAVYAWASHEPTHALTLLPRFFDSDPVLHSSEFVCRLIRHGLGQHLETIRPFVHQLLDSPSPAARLQGGIAACLARLHHHTENSLAEIALTGSTDARLGAARVAEANLLEPKHRAWCDATLRRLFNDTDTKVRTAAAHCFWPLWKQPNQPLTDFSGLIEAFLASPAFATDPSFLLHALEDSTARLPMQVLHVCEVFVRQCAVEARDIRTGIAGDEHTVGKLVFRAIAQLSDAPEQRRAVNLIDQMCLEGLNSAVKHLGEFER